MTASNCGNSNHKTRTCPHKDKDVPRDQALWMKFDNITSKEAAELQAQIIKDKNRIAPKARGTAAAGNKKELPNRIKDALKLLGDGDGSKKK